MRTRLPALIAATMMTSLVLLGCGSSGGGESADPTTASSAEATTTTAETTTTESATGTGDLCAALKQISDYDAQSTALISASTSWPEVQALFVTSTPTVLAAYTDAIAAAEGTLKDDLTTLRTYTEPTAELAGQSTSLIDFGTKLAAEPGVEEAGVAGQNLDTYSRQNCGFGTSSAGN